MGLKGQPRRQEPESCKRGAVRCDSLGSGMQVMCDLEWQSA